MPTLSFSRDVRITRTGEVGSLVLSPHPAEVLASLLRGAAAMPLTERTERALEACHDAILAPTRWPTALQSLAESLGAASCMFFEHDRENSPAPAPMSEGHVAFADRLTRNWAHAPDPHVGPYLQKCNSFQRAGWASVLEHDLSTEDERRTIPFYPETARPEKREWMAGSFFSVEGRNWCLPVFRGDDPFTPEDARWLARVGPYLGKIVSLAQKVRGVRCSRRNSRRWSE